MPRKSTRNAAKSTPEPKIEPRKTRRSSARRKRSPSKELEEEIVTPQETSQVEENCNNTVENEQNDNVDSDRVTEEKVETKIDHVESHTPPPSAVRETSDNEEIDAEKGKFKGINSTQVEENSEIKMNSVISVSADEASNNDNDDNIPLIKFSKSSRISETKLDISASSETIADSRETASSDTDTEKCDRVNEIEKTNGDSANVETVKNTEDDQAEEGEITESKSDEEGNGSGQQETKVKPPVKIKLRRDSLFESTVDEPPKKINWNPEVHRCLKFEFSDLNELKLTDFTTLSSDFKLADEDDVKLEETYKPKVINERIPGRTSVDANKSENDANGDQEDSNIIALNRKISIVDDAASKLKPPPSPAKQPVSAILFITNLVRPFTIKQLRELLERTGSIKDEGFWTDRIKSKCYVHYETVEEAEATRNALHGVNWPIGNGKKLIIDYATEEDMEKAKNPPPVQPPPVPQQVAPVKVPQKENEVRDEPVQDSRNGEGREERRRKISEKEREREKEKSRPAPTREWDIGKNSQKERSRSRSRERRRKHSRRSITPLEDFIARKQRKLEESVPQKLMDDLFQRTRTMPCVYWQPLSPEEISIKQQQRLTRMEEHKRRLEENSRNRGQREPGRGAYRRRYD